MASPVKQVIIVRTDIFSKKENGKSVLDLSLMGKMGIQISHAAKAICLNEVREGNWVLEGETYHSLELVDDPENDPVYQWCNGPFTGIAVKVKSEGKLLNIYEQAKEAGLPCSLIKDRGLTVFDEPTFTCVGIGPANSEDIDKITGKLRLL